MLADIVEMLERQGFTKNYIVRETTDFTSDLTISRDDD